MPTKSLKPKTPSTIPSPSTHLATIELKQSILNSLSKLSDRDTHQIAVENLETIIKTLSPETLQMTINTLITTTTTTTSTPIKKETIRLLSFICTTHTEPAYTHLIKIVTHIVKSLKDSDSGVKDSCCEAIGNLSFLYLKNGNVTVSWFLKPLFEAMNEQNKWVQSGAAMCLVKMVEMACDPPVLSFQKMCSKVCKFLNSPNFLANAALLPVVSRLAQVGTISPQCLDPLLQSIHECLRNADWTIRKAAADTLNALALHSSNLIIEKPSSTITILEACRFDKIKPVRDSITKALQLWKFIAENREVSEPVDSLRKNLQKLDEKRVLTPVQDGQTKGQNISVKSTETKKKGPPLSDKELNPEFFQRLERRVSGEVEVVVNRRFLKSSNLQNEEPVVNENDTESKSKDTDQPVNLQNPSLERGGGDRFSRQREFDNNGSLLGIQRQLLQLERKQTHLMNMLQDFKEGSRDGMVTLENRVWGLERVVEELARNLSSSLNTLRTSCYMNEFQESSGRSLGKYSGFSDSPYTVLGRNDDGRSYMGRGSSWDYNTHSRNPQIGSRRAMDSRSAKWVGPVRFGEGPSARSVWQASKDEATLEAIRGAAPETTAQVPGNENHVQNRDPLLSVWRKAMDGVHVGDMDMAFTEVLSSGDDLLLVKLMDKTGPLIDRLSGDVVNEVLHAVAQFFLEPSLFDICLSWIQQLLDMIVENGTDVAEIPEELKMEILVNLNEASSTIEPPENWEGLMPDQLLLRLASVWDINLQQLEKY